MIIKRFIALSALLFGPAQLSIVNCQLSIERRSAHSTLFGIGRVNHLDTYLSPLEYTGPQATYLHETRRNLQRNPHILFSTLTQGDFSYAHNPAKNAHDFGGNIRYDMGWGRQWEDALWHGLDLTAGGMTGGNVGFLYNNRNGNNPAQARLALQLSALVRADYHFCVRKQALALHYQAQLPLLGVGFMPQYGQSYYTLFEQGNRDHNTICTHPANALSLRQLLTFDIPIRRATLSVGYLSDLRQLRANGIKQHQYSRSFVIGYVRNLKYR